MYEYTNKRIGKQTLARQYYNSLPREERKIKLCTFISRVNSGLNYEDAMNLPYRYQVSRSSQIKHPERTGYRESYEGEKCPYQRFYARMMGGTMSMEEAINPEFRKGGYNKEKGDSHRRGKTRGINVKHADAIVVNPEYYKIEITYKEEAKIFKDVYQDMIDKLQSEYNNEEDTHRGTEILTKLNAIKQEYKIFLNFNK